MESKVNRLMEEVSYMERIYNGLAIDEPTVKISVSYNGGSWEHYITEQECINTIRSYYADKLFKLKQELKEEFDKVLA